jgi:hypothetical protein
VPARLRQPTSVGRPLGDRSDAHHPQRLGRLLQCIELIHKLLFAENFLRKRALGPVVRIYEMFHLSLQLRVERAFYLVKHRL